MLMPQLMGGHLAAGVTGELAGLQMSEGGKVCILIVSGSKRSTFMPKVPAFEAGQPGR
jgi:tripartite-type tricarboxylate transporter receptor subunit TctC